MISKFGGIFFEGDNNLANPGSLEYVLEEINQVFLWGRTLSGYFTKGRILP